MRRIALVAWMLAAGSALAQPSGTTPISVEVGQTLEVDVGYARGIVCDDLSVVRPGLVTRNDHNFFLAAGLKVGRTLCRVGTYDGQGPYFLFAVTVAPAKKR
jgi:hypothetical protein